MLPILENSSARLIAEQSPPNSWFFGTMSLVLLAGAAAFALRNRRWGLGVLFGLGALCMIWVVLPGPTYRITIDKAGRTVQWATRKGGKETSTESVSAGDLSSADMEFNRDARNIVLLHKDGTQSYPLGRQHFSGEPEQYVVLNAIRQLIGQAPTVPQSR